jgi:hypothetical protein
MFAFLLDPGIQQKLQVSFNNTLNITQVTFFDATFTGYPDRVEPKFRLIAFFGDMDMRRFMSHICFVEKELLTMDAKDDRHQTSEWKI